MGAHPVFLKHRQTGAIVEAELHDAIDESHLVAVDAAWKPILLKRIRKMVDEGHGLADWPHSWHWNWRQKMQRIEGLLAFQTLALTCDGSLQGLMQVNTANVSRLPGEAGKHLAYVDYVETAPWNRPEIVAQPLYKGVGVTMVRAAIEISRDEGFQGRIGLHSLPRSEAFYQRCNMTDLGIDGQYENLRYFEMTAAQAADFSR